ncbi:uncharacterized protein BXZ73DRAFT_82573 [Epithele typhae]|uniref:uncharacterized protein n=1 Tax=Epithele typhae TaxID=378194 RepID=UPI0020081E5C|nr:uncharacterized protein BXZ73DRAFT_82573 [Epithele typhae]KAH9911920.1 hypothetical protein BXZ73DRAFT_82573 [Epithele typhae]
MEDMAINHFCSALRTNPMFVPEELHVCTAYFVRNNVAWKMLFAALPRLRLLRFTDAFIFDPAARAFDTLHSLTNARGVDRVVAGLEEVRIEIAKDRRGESKSKEEMYQMLDALRNFGRARVDKGPDRKLKLLTLRLPGDMGRPRKGVRQKTRIALAKVFGRVSYEFREDMAQEKVLEVTVLPKKKTWGDWRESSTRRVEVEVEVRGDQKEDSLMAQDSYHLLPVDDKVCRS